MPVVQQLFPSADICAPAILVVEDEILIRVAVSDHLRACGYRVLEAANADDAVAIMCNDEKVALVFSDVRLPGSMDGLALGEWIRKNRPGTAVLLTSGEPCRALAPGTQSWSAAFLPKPYDLQDLASRITSVLAAPNLRAV